MLVFGTASGVFLTGLLLLKICDPDFKTPAMRDGSLGYSLNSVLVFILLPIMTGLAVEYGPIALALFGLALLAASVAGMFATSMGLLSKTARE